LYRNCLLKHVIEGMIDIRIDIMGGGGEEGEERIEERRGEAGGGEDNDDASNCRMTLWKDKRHI
jgi:hypothetical protein